MLGAIVFAHGIEPQILNVQDLKKLYTLPTEGSFADMEGSFADMEGSFADMEGSSAEGATAKAEGSLHGIARNIQAATSAQGFSNYGFILPSLANKGHMTPIELATYFNGAEYMSRTMTPLYNTYAHVLGFPSLKKALQNDEMKQQMQTDLTAFAQEIAIQILQITSPTVKDPQFYAALCKAEESSSSSNLLKVVQAAKQIYTIGFFGGEANRAGRGERIPIALKEKMLRTHLGLNSFEKSYKCIGTKGYKGMTQLLKS